MARYIDADALLERMKRDPLFPLVEKYGVSRVIEAEPTADVVEVVRCEDCKHKYVERDVWMCPFGLMMTPNGFCNYGERRDDG